MTSAKGLDRNVRFVVTGPSGWIGQAFMAHVASRLAVPGAQLVLADRVTAFASTARDMVLPWGDRLPVRALESICPDDVAGAHVVHLAYLTKEKAAQLGERRFMDVNLGIDDALLAAIAAAKPASLFVASSGAAKLAARGSDLHPYGFAKLMQEDRFLAWGRASAVPVVAGRIFNVAGPYINKVEAYAISNMVQQAMHTGIITIKAQVPVFRSFIHVDDLCGLIANAAIGSIDRAAPIDLCGAEIVEMEDLAVGIAKAFKRNITIARGSVDFTGESSYLGEFPHTKTFAMQTGITLRGLQSCISDTLACLT
ncbi:NAD-dependent epimerase/dehydratase family protein [Sandarakinorhabdus limnophila]|uniref:NAD-dependent epimerase/dehydratase family protein n=1 Tax=Sandarakinorhabdus limnophila TaxID=210512 RepID=UPI0003B68703|nr:NAD(P)-dependent oxidoreductase [Sandarakinorhabdus limnophila]